MTLFAAAGAIAVLAIWVRFHGLLEQTPFHDEWHALVAVATESAGQSMAKFGQADRSIPVVLWLHLLRSTLGLTAATLWLPFALAGLFGVALLPALLRRELGTAGGLALAALLATSPLLVLYSRFARPYAICALGAVAACLLLADFAERPSRSGAGLVAGLAIAVAWALPVFVPFLAGAMLVELARQVRPPRKSLWALLGVGVAISIALALLFAPALLADGQSLRQKALAGHPTWTSVATGTRLLLGAGHPGWLPALGALAVLGGICLHRAAPSRSRCLMAACAAQLVTVLALRPAELERPFVFARYLLPVGIVVLAAVAAGLGWIAMRSRVAGLLAAMGVALFVATTPLDRGLASHDNFASMRIYQRLFFSQAELEGFFPALPEAYRAALERDRGGLGAIVEVPYNGLLRVPYPYYQTLHRREVLLGQVESLCIAEGNRELPVNDESGIRLRRFVDLASRTALQSSGARFVILHQDVESEVPWVRQETRRRNRFDFSRCVDALRRSTGITPAIADGLAVFDLADL